MVLFDGNHLGNITTPIVSNVQLPVTHSMGTIYLWIVTTPQSNTPVYTANSFPNYTGSLNCCGEEILTIQQAGPTTSTWNVNIFSSINVRKLEYVILNDYLQ